jgi:predicted Zn-ribbon and HTH transcriptional regulator
MGQCNCEITPANCIDCDAEFVPNEADQDQCPACISSEQGNAA